MPSLFRNTGEQEIEQLDTNPASSSFGTRRWLPSGVNTTACPIPTPTTSQFRSALIAEVVYRDTCPATDLPDGVTYRLEIGFRTSGLSQADADAQARAYFDANKQAFANANDTCSPDPSQGTYSCERSPEGCWTGFVLHTIDGRRYYQTQSEYDTCFVASSVTGSGSITDLCPSV